MQPIRDDSRSVNVEWFSGTDAQKIQAAIDYLGANGGTVWLPRKVYSIDTMLEIGGADPGYQQGIELRGEGGGVATGLSWTGAPGAEAILKVRNSHYGAIRNIAFYGNGNVDQDLWFTHVAGDAGIVQVFEVEKCWFIDGKNYNVLIGEPDGGATSGDCGPTLFSNCYFQPSSPGGTTIAHVRQRAEDTFATTFIACRFTAQGGIPTKGFSIQGGTAHFFGCTGEIFSDALFYIDATAGIPIASIGAFGIEFQGGSGGQLLKTVTAGVGAAAALRATVLSQCMGDNIVAPLSPTTITWDINSAGALVLNGVHCQGDIEISDANANVFSNGVLFWDAADTFTGAGAGRVSGSWSSGNPASYHHRMPGLPTYANNGAALAGGLVAGDLYMTAAGAVMVVF